MEGQIPRWPRPDAAFQRAALALEAISATVFRLGEAPGAGARMKVINQMLAGVHIAAMAEAMVMAASQDMDLAEVHRVIQSCAGNSWMFANRGAHVVAGDHTPIRRSISSSGSGHRHRYRPRRQAPAPAVADGA